MTTPSESWTIARLLDWTRRYFEQANLESPRLCAEVLLAAAVGCQRIELYTQFNVEPSDPQRAQFRQWVKQAAEGTPVAYLVGTKEFFSLPFRVTKDVLIPRPETELLVAQAIEYLREKNRPANPHAQEPDDTLDKKVDLDELEAQFQAQGANRQPATAKAASPAARETPTQVWDVCTGTGCVAGAIATHIPSATILATDLCENALAVAASNFETLGLTARVITEQANGLTLPDNATAAVALAENRFDVIVSNPPYVAEGDPVGPGVDQEPRLALYAGPAGLDVLAPLIAAAPPFLKPAGLLLLEFGQGQADAVRDLICASGAFHEPRIRRDHQDIERTAAAIRR